MTGRILVLGVGNELLRDEGLGVRAVRILERENWPDNVEFLEGATFTQDLFHLLQDYAALLVLDVACFGGRPGEVRVLGEEDLTEGEGPRCSLHELDLKESLRLADELGTRPHLRLVVMEPGDCAHWGQELTGAVRAGLPGYLEAARREIRRLAADCAGVSPGTPGRP